MQNKPHLFCKELNGQM